MGDVLDLCMAFDLDQVEADLKAGHETTVQFDKPIGDTLLIVDPSEDDFDKWPQVPSAPYIDRLNAMCGQWGEKLTVRFYDHFGKVFDGNCVLKFPNAQSLHLGSLDEVANLEAAFTLPNLKRLCLSCFWLKDKRILEHLNFDNLTHLTVDQTDTKALDLAPLAQAQSLERLYLAAHHKNIGELAALANLREFTLSAKTGLDLSFINGMQNLTALKFNLGGTRSIADITLPRLQDLAFTMTRNLTELGDMQRFPELRRVFMQDQQHVERVVFGAGNAALEHLWFYNCKKLAQLEGLVDCPKLTSLRWIFTEKDPSTLELPASLRNLHMHSSKSRQWPKEKAAIEAMGYIADDHPDASFFYK